MWIFILVLVCSFALVYLTYYGCFNRLIIKEINYGPVEFFYLEYQGHYRHVGPTFDRVKRAAQRFFKEFQLVGIYYDDPGDLEDAYQGRAVLGFVPVGEIDNDVKRRFIESNGYGLVYKQLKYCEALYARFPYKSFLTFYVMGFRVYGKMKQNLKRRNIEEFGGIVEEYHFKKGYIDIILPYGSASESLKLTKLERPKYHIDKKTE